MIDHVELLFGLGRSDELLKCRGIDLGAPDPRRHVDRRIVFDPARAMLEANAFREDVSHIKARHAGQPILGIRFVLWLDKKRNRRKVISL